jgi:hypothetical protein
MKTRCLLATIVFISVTVSSTGQNQSVPYPYEAAGYVSGPLLHALRIFLSKGNAVTIALPFRLERATFAPDGKSVYGIIADSQSDVDRDQPSLSRIEFNPTRASSVAGTNGFIAIKSFAVSSRQDKIVISGNRQSANGRGCGVFEILVPNGDVRQILISDCHYQGAWDNLSLSPNGAEAIASVGTNRGDLHLERIDLVHGATKSLGSEFWMGIWSPDGKWIAARASSGYDRLFLIDASDFSRRRTLGGAIVLKPAWSPDSHYLLLWKEYLFRCGIYPDLEPPATLETLNIQTGKRSTIRSSRCQITGGPTGWVSSEIAK